MKRAVFRCWYEDDGGKYGRKISRGRYQVIEWIDVWSACGQDAEDGPRYSVELSEIDLDAIGEVNKTRALESCGWIQNPPASGLNEPMIVEALHGYGCRAPLGSWNGNSLKKLMAQARQRASELDDAQAHEEALSQPVNALGATAREYMQGDLMSAVDRGCREGRANAQIVAKMHGVKQEDIDAVNGKPLPQGVCASINLHRIDSDDPLAFVTGYMDAMAGAGLADGPDFKRKDLAKEYIRGYQLGVDVKAGDKPRPEWER